VSLQPITDYHYPVCRLDIRQDSEFATGYGYPKTAFKREPDTDPDIRNAFIDVTSIQPFGKSCTLHNHSLDSLSSEASFQPSVPWRRVYMAVIAWLESMTRLDSQFLVTRTRLESQSMTRDSSQSHFYKITGFLMDKPSSFAHKEMRIFCFSDDQDWGNFLFCLSSCAMLHFKDQVSPTCIEGDLRLCFLIGVSRGTIYWHLIVVSCSICILWSWQWFS